MSFEKLDALCHRLNALDHARYDVWVISCTSA